MKIHPRRAAKGLVLCLMLLGLTGGIVLLAQAGQLIRVCASGCDYADLREAVSKAADGSTLFVDAGQYAGPVIISKNLSIVGNDRNQVVITRGVIAAGPFQVSLRNVTLTQGLNGLQAQAPAGLPRQLSPAVSLQGVTIAGNAANGIALFDFSRASLCDVLITRNGISVLGLPIGGGIALRGSARVAVSSTLGGQSCGQTVIRENGANGISAVDNASVAIGRNTFITKHGLSGVQLGGSARGTIQGLTSRENACYGVAVEENAQATLTGGQLERNAKAGLHVGGPSSTLPGCVTNADASTHAIASVSGTAIAGNAIGILVGDLSKDLEQATVEITSVTLISNGCDLVVDPVARKSVKLVGTTPKSCS
jgi:hypothetical protein